MRKLLGWSMVLPVAIIGFLLCSFFCGFAYSLIAALVEYVGLSGMSLMPFIDESLTYSSLIAMLKEVSNIVLPPFAFVFLGALIAPSNKRTASKALMLTYCGFVLMLQAALIVKLGVMKHLLNQNNYLMVIGTIGAMAAWFKQAESQTVE